MRILSRLLFAASFLVFAMQAGTAAAIELPDFRQLVKDNSPAIVNISTTQKVSRSRQSSQLEDLLRQFGGPGAVPMPQQPRDVQSLGSGFFISSDGKILTNAHVVKGADKIVVRLSDHSEKSAKVIGSDERTDVALLKIEGKGYPTLRLGNSDALQVGEWVLAIGSPFGLEYSATQGIVSALGRALPDDTYVPFIQTDVAVNPGNSGGPLFNTKGEVVGINSQIFSRSGGYMGLSFAIPIKTATQVVAQLEKNGKVQYGWLGVGIQPVTQDLARSFGMDKPTGALVSQVMPKSPAAKAGVEVGDIITGYEGHTITQSFDLPQLVGATTPGSKATLEILREGKQKTLVATIDTLKEDTSQGGDTELGEADALGLNVADLTPQQRDQLDLAKGGVLVTDVDEGAAASAGIQPGDVLLKINKTDILSAAQFAKLVRGLPKNQPIPVLLQRNGNNIFLAITLS
jgi:serine protease Do